MESKTALLEPKPKPRLIDAQEVVPGVFLGPSNAAKNQGFLGDCKISCIVNCTKESEVPNYFPSAIEYVRVPIDDEVDAPIQEYLLGAVAKMTLWRQEGKRILVHCECGISRSTTVLITYLLHIKWSGLVSVDSALNLIKTRRLWAEPNEGFIKVLMSTT